MTDEAAYDDILQRARNLLTSTENLATEVYDTLESDANNISTGNYRLVDLRDVTDSWESLRAKVSKASMVINKNLSDAEDSYKDGLRKEMVKGSRRAASSGQHYAEREASYETNNLSRYKILRIMEKASNQLKELQRYVHHRTYWLDQLRKEVADKEASDRFVRSNEFRN